MNVVDLARESLSLPAEKRRQYVQDQAVLVIGYHIRWEEIDDALRDVGA